MMSLIWDSISNRVAIHFTLYDVAVQFFLVGLAISFSVPPNLLHILKSSTLKLVDKMRCSLPSELLDLNQIYSSKSCNMAGEKKAHRRKKKVTVRETGPWRRKDNASWNIKNLRKKYTQLKNISFVSKIIWTVLQKNLHYWENCLTPPS